MLSSLRIPEAVSKGGSWEGEAPAEPGFFRGAWLGGSLALPIVRLGRNLALPIARRTLGKSTDRAIQKRGDGGDETTGSEGRAVPLHGELLPEPVRRNLVQLRGRQDGAVVAGIVQGTGAG